MGNTSITPVLLGLAHGNIRSAIGCDDTNISNRTWDSDYDVSFLMSEKSGPILYKIRLALAERDEALGEIQNWKKLTESEENAKIYGNVDDSELGLIYTGFASLNLKARFDVTWEDGFGIQHKTPCCFFEGKTKSSKEVIFGGPIQRVDDKLENLDFFVKFASQSIDAEVVKENDHIISSCHGGYSHSIITLALIRMGLGHIVIEKIEEGHKKVIGDGSAKETFEEMVYHIAKRRWIDAYPDFANQFQKTKARDKSDVLTREDARYFASIINHCILSAFITKNLSSDKDKLSAEGRIVQKISAARKKVYDSAEQIIKEVFSKKSSIVSEQLPLNQALESSPSSFSSSKENAPTGKKQRLSLLETALLSQTKRVVQNGQSSSATKSSHAKKKMPHNEERNNSDILLRLPAKRRRIDSNGPAELPHKKSTLHSLLESHPRP